MTEFHELMVAILRSGTPLVYVTMAGVIAQRAGVWHLGLEGVMIIGACATIPASCSPARFRLPSPSPACSASPRRSCSGS